MKMGVLGVKNVHDWKQKSLLRVPSRLRAFVVKNSRKQASLPGLIRKVERQDFTTMARRHEGTRRIEELICVF